MQTIGLISQERLKIEVKLLVSVNRKSLHAASISITLDDFECMTVSRIARYLCGS